MANPSCFAVCALCFVTFSTFAQSSGTNLLAPAAGGTIVRFTATHSNIAGLIDPARRNPVTSSEAKFPQEIVFAFRDGTEALVDSVSIKPDARAKRDDWPRRVQVAVSTRGPLDGFEDAGVLSLEQEAEAQSLSVGKSARYLKLRVLDNFGGKRLSLGEVKAFESTADGYVPVAKRKAAEAEKPRVADPGPPDANEPNDTPAQATRIEFGKAMRGSINPPGEQDFFALNIRGNAPRVLNMALDGEPNIRTSVALLRGGREVKQFDPSKALVERAELSWLVEPDDYQVRLTEPPVSLVLIWDSSNSMKGNEAALQRGVEAFIAQVKAPDRVQLVQFSSKIEVLTSNFLSDSAELQKVFKKGYKLTSGTAFFDAVRKGAELLEGVPGNRAIVVMTDGADTQSKTAPAEFWRFLAEKRIRLYTIGLGKEMNRFVDKTGTTAKRNLAHLADATNGKFFFTERPEQLLNLYEEISAELKAVSQYRFTMQPSRGDGSLLVHASAGRRTVTNALTPMEIIFDASGSMRERLGSRRKIEVMKQVIPQIINSLPPQQEVALRVYGHRVDSQRPGARTDSEPVIPLGRVDKARLNETIEALSPRGTTPIAHSLAQLPNDFANVPGEKTVVLVTDGREEAGGDPVQVVRDLLARGFKFRLNVVGFALGDRESKLEMQTIAEMTGGRFYDASSAAALRDAVEQSVVEDTLALPFTLLDAAGDPVLRGVTGAKGLSVPEGTFALKIETGAEPLVLPAVRISPETTTRVQVSKVANDFVANVQ